MKQFDNLWRHGFYVRKTSITWVTSTFFEQFCVHSSSRLLSCVLKPLNNLPITKIGTIKSTMWDWHKNLCAHLQAYMYNFFEGSTYHFKSLIQFLEIHRYYVGNYNYFSCHLAPSVRNSHDVCVTLHEYVDSSKVRNLSLATSSLWLDISFNQFLWHLKASC